MGRFANKPQFHEVDFVFAIPICAFSATNDMDSMSITLGVDYL